MRPIDEESELREISDRYARRSRRGLTSLYDLSRPANYMLLQERERRLIEWINASGLGPAGRVRLLEVGCGDGANLLQFLRLGFAPENLVGNDLLAERVEAARHRLPAALQVLAGNAVELEFPPGTFDVVFQSTVFSSILDDTLQSRLASHMWRLVRPGGGVLWYDFVYDNPGNPDVRGVRPDRIRQLFPESTPKVWRVTLAPPLARSVTRLSPIMYTLFNAFPFLRTHVMAWLPKPGGASGSGRIPSP